MDWKIISLNVIKMLYPISVSGGAIEDLLRVMVRILAKVLLFVKLYISKMYPKFICRLSSYKWGKGFTIPYSVNKAHAMLLFTLVAW